MKCYISHNGACWLCWIWWFISISCDTMISHPRLFWWICYGSCLCTRPRQFKGSVQQMEKILSVILFLGYSDCDKTALFYLKSLLGLVFRTPAGYWSTSWSFIWACSLSEFSSSILFFFQMHERAKPDTVHSWLMGKSSKSTHLWPHHNNWIQK